MEMKDSETYIISTDNLITAIKEASMSFGVSMDKVDFNIQKVTTTIKNKKTRETRNVSSLNHEELTDSYLMFNQSYDFIMKKKQNNNRDFPNVVFANNKLHTTAYLIIKKYQDLKLKLFSKEDFLGYLESILLKKKCFIRVDEKYSLSEEIDKLYDVYVENKITNKDIKIKVIDFPSPVKPIPDSLEMVYEKNKEDDRNKDNGGNVKLASIKEGSIVVKYHKVIEGVIGRTYEGKILTVTNIKANHIPNFSIDSNTIKKEDNSKNTTYIAKKTGFVFFEKKFLRIDNETEMNTANIRNKDKLVTSLDDGVSINIKSKDKLSDAVAGNIDVKSDKVNINGNVGPSATVEGNIVEIGGQTHLKSKIKAKKGHIAIHKGTLEGEDVVVDRLEGGSIIAKRVHVKVARGGYIEGETIIIDSLESNVKIISSSKIQVKNIVGESNTFSLKPLIHNVDNKEETNLEGLIEEEESLEDIIKKLEKKLEEKLFLIEFNEKSLNMQRDDKIDKLQYHIRSSQAMDSKLKAYIKLQNDKDKLENDTKKNNDKLEAIRKKIKGIYENSQNAFMEVNSVWTGGNSVDVHHNGESYSFYPTKGTIQSPISFDILKKQNLI